MFSETIAYIVEVVVEMYWNYSSGDRFFVAMDGTKTKMADFSVCWYCSLDRGLMNVWWNCSFQLLEAFLGSTVTLVESCKCTEMSSDGRIDVELVGITTKMSVV